MLIDPSETSTRDMYQHMIRAITPRPIAWVSSVSNRGIVNLAPFSFFSGVTANPPSVVISVANRRDGSKKDTLLNIEENGQFVVNVVNRTLAEAMNQTSAEYPPEVDEFEAAGLTPIPSMRINPPRVSGAPIQMECELIQVVPVGEGPAASHLVIGRILVMHVDDQVVDKEGNIDPSKVDAVGRMGGASYTTTRDRFDLSRPELN